ncbi:hypothetical protein ACFSCZ_04930 [Siminovitchia sediminis]|uniref:Uncharacterized protein n=1 Tax=Siminovitchia sediminis TaxID=1274353 RepID=A0ABW4KE23_9BACI
MKMKKMLASCLLAGALVTSLPMATFAKKVDKKVVDYVALGDSLAAGVTPTVCGI